MHNENEDKRVFKIKLYIRVGTDASPNNPANDLMPDNIQASNLPQWKFRIKMPSSCKIVPPYSSPFSWQ